MNNHSVGVIIQARVGSSRLPGKILMKLPFNGSKDSLSWIFDELKSSSIFKHIILATSTAPENQILSTLAAHYGIGYYQGSENNVLSRFADVIRLYGLNVVVRITGDNPIIDIHLIEEVVKSHIKDQQDYSYTVNLPLGMNIEVFSTEAFLSFKDYELDDSDREHVTIYFKKSNKFKIREYYINHSLDYEKIRVTLDYPNDYVLLNLIMQIAESQSINGLKLIEWVNGEMPWLWEVNNKMQQITPN